MRPPTNAKFHRALTAILASSTAFVGATFYATTAQAGYSTGSAACPSDMTLVGHTCVDKWRGRSSK